MSVSELVPYDISSVQPRLVKEYGKCLSMRLALHSQIAQAKGEAEKERERSAWYSKYPNLSTVCEYVQSEPTRHHSCLRPFIIQWGNFLIENFIHPFNENPPIVSCVSHATFFEFTHLVPILFPFVSCSSGNSSLSQMRQCHCHNYYDPSDIDHPVLQLNSSFWQTM